MKRILLPILLLVNIFCFARGKEAVADNNNKSLLWCISGNGLTGPSYLFGTMHIICSDKYLWTPKMAACLDSSATVCLEMNLDDPAVMTKVATAMISNDGVTLDSYFTKEQNEQLKKYVKDSLGMDINMLAHINLVGLETMLAVGGEGDCKNPVSYEEKILETAHNTHKEVAGLEEPEEQIALLNKIPTDSVVHDILDIITGKKEDVGEYDKLIAAYVAQDLPALYAMIKDGKSDIGDLNAFLDERNEKWIGRMVAKMIKQSIFFAVGAGHLWGNNGVIALLKKAGYTVTPIL